MDLWNRCQDVVVLLSLNYYSWGKMGSWKMMVDQVTITENDVLIVTATGGHGNVT